MALLVALRLVRRWLLRTQKQSEQPLCANCGYDLTGLDLPRCPECGALRGFCVPLDQLGLTEAEIRAGFEQQRRRRAVASEPGAPGAAKGAEELKDPSQ